MTAIVTVRVHARASRAKAQWNGDVLELWVTEPAIDNAANEAVLRAVAGHVGVPMSRVRLRSGFRSRTKVVEVEQA